MKLLFVFFILSVLSCLTYCAPRAKASPGYSQDQGYGGSSSNYGNYDNYGGNGGTYEYDYYDYPSKSVSTDTIIEGDASGNDGRSVNTNDDTKNNANIGASMDVTKSFSSDNSDVINSNSKTSQSNQVDGQQATQVSSENYDDSSNSNQGSNQDINDIYNRMAQSNDIFGEIAKSRRG